MLLETLRKFQSIQLPHLTCEKKLSQKISTVRLNSSAKTIIGVVNSGLIQYFDTLYLHKGLETYYLATLQSTSIDKKLEV